MLEVKHVRSEQQHFVFSFMSKGTTKFTCHSENTLTDTERAVTCLLRTRVPSSPEASEASGEQGGTSSIPGEEGNCLCGENTSGGKGIYRYFCCGLSMKLFACLISLHTFSVLFLSYSLLHASFINFVSIFSCLFIAVVPGCTQNLFPWYVTKP